MNNKNNIRPFSSITTNKFDFKNPVEVNHVKNFKNPVQAYDFYNQEKKFGLNNNRQLNTRDRLTYKHNIITGDVNEVNPWNFDRFNYSKNNKRVQSSNKGQKRLNDDRYLYDPITDRYMNLKNNPLFKNENHLLDNLKVNNLKEQSNNNSTQNYSHRAYSAINRHFK